MSTIFISHSSSDNALASELGKRLAQQNHHSVFLDLDPEQGIVAGQSWEQTLYRKLRACRGVIALITDNYLDSQWCFAEIALARMEGKHIIALQADPLSEGAKMPAILTERQFIDLRSNAEDGYRRLWKGLKQQDLLGVAGEWDPNRPPYLGLSAYQEEHAPVFFGREDESRAGLELLSRGAPGLIMVLGASGSGKSSLVRAGMLPRLRREEGQWLVVDPFRPGRDPYIELAESFVQTWRRYAPEHASRVGNADEIRSRLEAWSPRSARPAADAAPQPESAEAVPADQRLARLIQNIEDLRNDPPAPLQDRLRTFLDWGLDDLRRITGEPVLSGSAPMGSADSTPLVDLAQDLQRASGQRSARVLLIVDQFEELLGRDKADDKANRFLDLIRASLEVEHGPLMALGTMRSDFLGLFQRNAALRGIDFESLSLGPMRLDGMRRVIEEPAMLGAIELETGLADRLIADTETPDALPLLSFTLSVLWRDFRQDGKLDVREYEQLGGLTGAIAGEADALLASAKQEGKEEPLRRAFLRMARLTEDGGFARQPVAWDAEELGPVHPILERFVERRLLVTRAEGGTRMVEVAHEALFRSWTPLKTWLDNDRTDLLLRQQIKRDARTWQESKRTSENLWRGGRLQQARELLRKGQLSELEREFVRLGQRRRMRGWLLAGSVTVSVIAGLGVLYLQARQAEADAVQAQAVAQRKALEASSVASHALLLSGGDDLGALLAGVRAGIESKRDEFPADLRRRVAFNLGSVVYGVHEKNRLKGHTESVASIAFDPDSKWLASGSGDGTIRLWDLESGQAIKKFDSNSRVESISFSPDGKWLASGLSDGTIELWDVADESTQEWTFRRHSRGVESVSFSPTHMGMLASAGGRDSTVGLWRVSDGSEIEIFNEHKLLVEEGETSVVSSVGFSPDGSMLASAGSWHGTTVIVRNMPGGTEFRRIENVADIGSITFSPDSTKLAAGSWSREARLWDVRGGKEVWKRGVWPSGSWSRSEVWNEDVWTFENKAPFYPNVYSVDFSPDGKWLAMGGLHETVRIVDAQNGSQSRTFFVPSGDVRSVSFSPDGRWLAAGGEDQTIRLWQLGEVSESWTFNKPRKNLYVYSVSFSPNGKLLASGGRDGFIRVWDAETGEKTNQIKVGSSVNSVSFGPHNKLLASGDDDGDIKLWDVAGGDEPKQTFKKQASSVSGVAFSPGDGSQLVSVSDGAISLWNVEDAAKPIRTFKTGPNMSIVSFGLSGETLAAATRKGEIQLWNIEDDTKPFRAFTGHPSGSIYVSFCPGGKTLATGANPGAGGVPGEVAIWDVAGGDKPKWKFIESPLGIRAVGCAAYGKYFASEADSAFTVAVSGNTLKLWNLADGKELWAFKGLTRSVSSAAVSLDGKKLALGNDNNTITLLSLDLDGFLVLGCEWLQGYLSHNPDVSEEDRKLCDDILSSTANDSIARPGDGK